MGRGKVFKPLGQVRALAMLALLAMALRAVVPAGFMPEAGRFFSAVICTGSGAVEVVFDRSTGEPTDPASHDPSSRGAGEPCFFSASAQHTGAAAPPSAIVARVEFDIAAEVPATLLRGIGLAAPPPQATAPPRTA